MSHIGSYYGLYVQYYVGTYVYYRTLRQCTLTLYLRSIRLYMYICMYKCAYIAKVQVGTFTFVQYVSHNYIYLRCFLLLFFHLKFSYVLLLFLLVSHIRVATLHRYIRTAQR